VVAPAVSDLVLEELRTQTQLLRLLVVEAMTTRARQVIAKSTHVRVYALTDGARTARDIAAAAGVGLGTVSRLWTSWAREGLIAPSTTTEGRWAAVVPAARLAATEEQIVDG
jgi:transposase